MDLLLCSLMEYHGYFAQHLHLLLWVAGLQGGPELAQLCRSSQRVRPATGFEENRPLSQLFILKFSQNFLQLMLSKLLVLMGRVMFWGRKQATNPGCFIRVPSE